MPGRIILTADRTLMSDYRHNEFVGFGACAPPNVIPDLIYKWIFFPSIKAKNGVPVAAPYGLRKIEAQLLQDGFNVSTVMPSHLGKRLPEAQVLGVHAMDPFGLGPASTTLAFAMKKEPFLAQHFRLLMKDPAITKAKRNGLKVLVGGPGSWQFRHRPEALDEFGIDCVVSGEAEKVIGEVIQKLADGDDIPKFFDADIHDTPNVDEIPDIVDASINGLIEIGRGCCRGCQFCAVTLRPLRWYPVEKIEREIDANKKHGVNIVCFHAEDVMLYGSKNTTPDDRRLLDIHELASKKCDGITWSHCSLAAVAAKPKLFEKVSEEIRQKQPWWGVEIGIETGSPRLVKKVMPAKAHPFKSDDWPDVVRTGMGLMHDNNLIPAATLIVGTPEETEDDLLQTLELMDDLKDMRSLIVPLFFVPVGRLKDRDWFKETLMTDMHKQLLIKCMEHDFRWIDRLVGFAFLDRWQGALLRPLLKVFISAVKRKVRKAGIPIK